MLQMVLIVAKCNVNYLYYFSIDLILFVLIVAKCNVNWLSIISCKSFNIVLIVAKCNVNSSDFHALKLTQMY